MTIKNIEKAIFPIPKTATKPLSIWEAKRKTKARTTYSREYWLAASTYPVVGDYLPYEHTRCKEHDILEAVPRESFYTGWLNFWYAAGLHPRWSIWVEIVKRYPNFRRSWIFEITRSRWTSNGMVDPIFDMSAMLRKYQKRPDLFVKELVKAHDSVKNVRMTLGGRVWTVPRLIRDHAKNKDFTVAEFLSETNQTWRRIMLLSRSFTIEEVVGNMIKLAQDSEGEILQDRNQQYLHVVCPTTGEHYLLGIPTVVVCEHGHKWRLDQPGNAHSIDPDRRWSRCQPKMKYPLGTVGNLVVPGWTPADARRWTFGLEPDAQFVKEA